VIQNGFCFVLVGSLLVSFSLFSQNMVRNGSFEEYFTCPGSYSLAKDGNLAPGWVSANRGTPDLYNACSKGDAGVPTNWAGHSKAYTGKGYSGIYCFTNTGYREYLQTELTTPMKPGGNYYIEFYYKLSSNSKFSIDRIGFFLNDSANRRNDDFVVYSKPTYELVLPAAYTRTTGIWAKCGIEWQAKGGERFLTIGNFSDNKTTRTYQIKFSKAKEAMLNQAAYYFIDDVRVISLDTPPLEKIPVIAGYPEIEINKTYVLKNIFFEFDRAELVTNSFSELDKWLEVIRARPKWKIELTGHTDERGSDEYNLRLSKQRVENVAAYLIQSKVAANRITTKGEGKTKPLTQGKDEAAHAINRRVEIRFSEK